MSDAPDVWSDDLPPGGMVCGTCGQPTESEPCRDHQTERAGAVDWFQSGPVIALSPRSGTVRLLILGGTEITVSATPAGRRVYLTVEDGRLAEVQMARRTAGGRWS